MASSEGLAAWTAALGPRTAREVDRIGQAVGVRIPGPVEDTNPVEESHMELEGNHGVENLADLRGRNADSVREGSIGESTVAVGTLEDLADEVVGAESAAAGVAVDAADSAGEVERQVAAAPVGSEPATSMKECRSGEHSAYKYGQNAAKAASRSKTGRSGCLSEGRQRKFPHGCALSVVQIVFHPKCFITQRAASMVDMLSPMACIQDITQ